MKMISIDDLIEYCDSERAAYKANNCGAACTALRRVEEFAKEYAKEYAVEAEPVDRWISVATITTGNNVATVDYQTTGEFINYDNIEEMTEM